MSVGDVVAFYLSLIICNCFLSYCVLNFSSCFILRQVCEAICPVGCCCYIKALHYISICKKVDLDAGWTFAILIIRVIPGLCSSDGNFFRSVSVSQGGYSSVLACIGQFVAFWKSFLFPGVLDCFSICFFRKIRYGLCPIILSIQNDGCTGCFSVCKKAHGNALRTFSILVFNVSPDLGYSCTGLAWSIAVGDVVSVYR